MELKTIKDIRKGLKLTQREFANKIGMSTNTFIFKEKKNQFYFSEIGKICDTFNIDVTVINYEELK